MGWSDLFDHRWNPITKTFDYPNHASAHMVFNRDNCQFEPPGLDQKSVISSTRGAPVRKLDNAAYDALRRKPDAVVRGLLGRDFDICGDLAEEPKDTSIQLGQADITNIVKFVDAPEEGRWMVVRKNFGTVDILNLTNKKFESHTASRLVERSEIELVEGP